MKNVIERFIDNMIFSQNYEGIRIQDIREVEEAQLLFKKGDKFDHYVVVIEEKNIKDVSVYRDVILHNTEKVPEIIYLVARDKVDIEVNSQLKQLVELNIGSVVFMDLNSGSCTNVFKCTENIFREINQNGIKAYQHMSEGIAGKVKQMKKYWVTSGLVILNILLFLITVFQAKEVGSFGGTKIMNLGALWSLDIKTLEYYRIISSGFLHWSLSHLVSNLIGLIAVGIIIEEIFGKTKFLLIYFISMITSSVASLVFVQQSISAGASGALFGLIGAYLGFGFMYRKKLGKSYLNRLLRGILIMVLVGFGSQNVNNAAHIGGLFGGIITGVICVITSKTYKASSNK